MFKNRFFILAILLLFTGCVQTERNAWINEYGTLETGAPVQMQYGTLTQTATDNLNHKIAVLLPLSEKNSDIGRSIRTAVEIAVLRRAPQNISVSFYDTAQNPTETIQAALSTNPEFIIGPLVAQNTRALRDIKPQDIPVLSFTSDISALGNGVMTMALLPSNSIEAIIKEISADGADNFIIFAPNTGAGHLMAGVAETVSRSYNLHPVGLFYYNEKDPDSIKDITKIASMNAARTAANTRAREILSDILNKEKLTAVESSSLKIQLTKISKSDTLGKLPYSAVLFLGDAGDSENLASFLRYYGVGLHEARFYGTAIWDNSGINSDLTMSGAKYAALPQISPEFSSLYGAVSGKQPGHLEAFGYDAANMAINMFYSQKSRVAYLLNPGGYAGTDGLFRLKPDGESERALEIIKLDGSGATQRIRPSAQNFIIPIYSAERHRTYSASPKDLENSRINPTDYIRIPDRFYDKYGSKTYGTYTAEPAVQVPEIVAILPEDDSDTIISPDFQPITTDKVDRTLINDVEITE